MQTATVQRYKHERREITVLLISTGADVRLGGGTKKQPTDEIPGHLLIFLNAAHIWELQQRINVVAIKLQESLEPDGRDTIPE